MKRTSCSVKAILGRSPFPSPSPSPGSGASSTHEVSVLRPASSSEALASGSCSLSDMLPRALYRRDETDEGRKRSISSRPAALRAVFELCTPVRPIPTITVRRECGEADGRSICLDLIRWPSRAGHLPAEPCCTYHKTMLCSRYTNYRATEYTTTLPASLGIGPLIGGDRGAHASSLLSKPNSPLKRRPIIAFKSIRSWTRPIVCSNTEAQKNNNPLYRAPFP